MASITGRKAICPGSGCRTGMPSNRYSLVRGRPPLIRGNAEPDGSATPGASAMTGTNERPFSGTASAAAPSITVARVASARGAERSPLTSTVSSTRIGAAAGVEPAWAAAADSSAVKIQQTIDKTRVQRDNTAEYAISLHTGDQIGQIRSNPYHQLSQAGSRTAFLPSCLAQISVDFQPPQADK